LLNTTVSEFILSDSAQLEEYIKCNTVKLSINTEKYYKGMFPPIPPLGSLKSSSPHMMDNGEISPISTDSKSLFNPNKQQSRIGAFEVQVAYQHPIRGLVVALLHSKLTLSKWPNPVILKRRLLLFLSRLEIGKSPEWSKLNTKKNFI
jgi:hypothetical protein